MRQRQFLNVVDEDAAHASFRDACSHLGPEAERVPLDRALGRILADDVAAAVDVPGFDRSNVDGFAVHASDTYGAEELEPIALSLSETTLAAGNIPREGFDTPPGTAVQIATGGVVPRGTDAVVMIEHTEPVDKGIEISRSVAPGANISYAGSDIGRGDTVLRRGIALTSRDTAVLAAVGIDHVDVVSRPRVGVVSTGDEIVRPGGTLEIGQVFDSNQPMLLDAVAELGCEPVPSGIAPDDLDVVESMLEALVTGPNAVDVVLLSGGTSKGEGDVNSEAISRLAGRLHDSPGIIVHGVALKPGKPILLSILAGTPVVVLPGFPTSAVFTFHEFVAPLLRRLSAMPDDAIHTVEAVAPMRIASA
ncbi:MAG: molybdenum cofactor synthesis domain-containing protein, partial [Actinomycetota bacterium]|nr:molybdenum cofactor synthesis domain-containing protein [Actinomycetota bacterium]